MLPLTVRAHSPPGHGKRGEAAGSCCHPAPHAHLHLAQESAIKVAESMVQDTEFLDEWQVESEAEAKALVVRDAHARGCSRPQ